MPVTVALVVALSVTVALAVPRSFTPTAAAERSRPVGVTGSAAGTTGVEEELRRTRDELRRARQLVNLAETLDLDEVLARVLQSAAVLADADAAAVVVFDEGDRPMSRR